MIRNYLLITFAVLKRRKFFTFISLFGIGFTLLVLILLAAFIEHLVGPNYPEYEKSRSLYVSRMELVDTVIQSQSTSQVGLFFIKEYVSKLKTPEKIGVTSFFNFANTFIDNKKVSLKMKFTNAAFWEVFHFQFLEGRPYNEQEFANGNYLAVITAHLAETYFGTAVGVEGRTILADNVNYKVVGVVKAVPVTRIYSSADIYLPYTTSKENMENKKFGGNYCAVLLAANAKERAAMKDEFDSMMARLKNMQIDGFRQVYSYADSYPEALARMIIGSTRTERNIPKLMIGLMVLALLFMLLPSINLVNINLSRIMERASEIGVRKAFGASSRSLVLQFVIENIVLTLIGGLLAIGLSILILSAVNRSGLIPDSDLRFNGVVFLVSLGLSLLFGVLSGVYPAWRMSKMHVVEALRTGE